MDMQELFRRAEQLRDTNRMVREAVAETIEQSKAALEACPDFQAIAKDTGEFAASRANACKRE